MECAYFIGPATRFNKEKVRTIIVVAVYSKLALLTHRSKQEEKPFVMNSGTAR